MALSPMPDLGPMLLPGADDYSQACLRMADAAARAVPHVTDIAYGADSFHRLDIWLPRHCAVAGLPVIVFFHGGAWRNGYKEWIGAMAPAIAAMPAILVAPNYRLVPQVRLSDVIDDARDALTWVGKNIHAYGGDPYRLILSGHSAGGYLAAILTVQRDGLHAAGLSAQHVLQCIPVSGLFGFEPGLLAADDPRHQWRHELFSNEREATAATFDHYLEDNSVPFHFVYGERDLPEVVGDHQRILERAESLAFPCQWTRLAQADHFEAHIASCSDDSAFMKAVQSASVR